MVKSGLIFGALSFFLVIGSALITPFCAPCVGLFIGLVAGYVAGVLDKPGSSGDSIKKGAIAGAIAGCISLIGGLVGGVLNSVILSPENLQALYQTFGIPTAATSHSSIWLGQLGAGFCIGFFNIAWMAIFGLAGGALWYQITGKNLVIKLEEPQELIPPG